MKRLLHSHRFVLSTLGIIALTVLGVRTDDAAAVAMSIAMICGVHSSADAYEKSRKSPPEGDVK